MRQNGDAGTIAKPGSKAGTMKENKNEAGAALYLRLSKEDGGGESASIGNQRSLLRRYAQQHNIAVYREYADDGYTGTDFERPAFRQMLCDIERGKVHTVLTKDLSRLGRDYIQTGYYLEKYFPEHRVRYISLLDGIDSARENGYDGDIAPFRAVMNDMYAKDISKKIRSVKRDKQRNGLFIGGKAPYGYRVSETDKNRLLIDETAAETVRQIFAWAAAGKRCSEIARLLNEAQVPTPLQYAGLKPAASWAHYSGCWQPERISFMLKNEVYIGNMVQGRARKAGYKSKKILRQPSEQWIVAKGTHEAIVDKKTFSAAQYMLQKHAKTRTRKYDYLWKELMYCAVCGERLSAAARELKSGTVLYLTCRSYRKHRGKEPCLPHMVRENEVKDSVMEYVKTLAEQCFGEKEWAVSVMRELYREEAETEILRLRRRIRHTELLLQRMYEDRAEGLVSTEDFRRLYARKKKEQRLAEQQLQKYEMRDSERSTLPRTEEFWKAAETEKSNWYHLLERIEITPEQQIHLYFRFQKPSFCV